MIQWGFPKSYSQLNQDVKVLRHYGFKKNGYFLEIGSHDGRFLSNTYLLEKQYNWSGICVEADPTTFKQLVVNRPNAYCVNKAVFHTSGLTLDFTVSNHGAFSGLTDTIHPDVTGNTISVETISMIDLLDSVNAPRFIEYFSLDTEGSEYEILKTFDFSKYKFGVIHVEHNFEEPKRSQIRALLTSNGYKFLSKNNWDDIYVLE